MLLSDTDIQSLIDSKQLIIDPYDPKDLREASVKLHMQKSIIKYKDNNLVDLRSDTDVQHYDFELYDTGYKMQPNEFFLGVTAEKITMPNGYFGLIQTRGSAAQVGLEAIFGDGQVDPGTDGHIKLPIKNNSNQILVIYPGLYIAKLYIFQMSSPALHPYTKA
jgi:dCTP deaminase